MIKFFIRIAHAAPFNYNGLPGPSSNNATDVDKLLNNIITWAVTIIAIVAFFSLIYSGFLYITAGGDASKAEKAQKNIVWAILGLVIAVTSYVILRFVVNQFS